MSLLELALLVHTLAPLLDRPELAVAPVAPVALSVRAQVAERPAPTPFTTTGPARRGPVHWPAGNPATRASAALIELAETIEATRTHTIYSHRTKVRREQGIYQFDCSGMVNWMLARASKTALATLDRERPVAASYVRVIRKAPTSKARGGWQQIATIEQVESGDIFAWRRPPSWPKTGTTGHVGLVLGPPVPVPHLANAYLVRIIDSTRWRHQDDTRGPGEDGFGVGTIMVVTDDSGQPIGYGWHGSDSAGYYETDIVFGRVH